MSIWTGIQRLFRPQLASSAGVGLRAAPLQTIDSQRYSYGVRLDVVRHVAQYALNPSVYTAVSRIAEAAAEAELRVVRRNDRARLAGDHPLLDLVGRHGRPNDYQDAFEFFEEHFTMLDLSGNVFWYWVGKGQPEQVYILPSQQMRIIPGRDRTVGAYIYYVNGQEAVLSPESVTHFKRPNPFNRYYGLPALEAILRTVIGDNAMTKWNIDFFGDGVATPAGMLIIPASVPDAEMRRIDDELNWQHGGGRRKTRIVRADPGAAVWHEAGLKQRDMDFIMGLESNQERILSALNMPVGLLAKASTEAHARVAERQLALAVQRRLTRTAMKLNMDALTFWDGWKYFEVTFEDVVSKHTDWQQQSFKVQTLLKVMDVNEVRAREFSLPPTKGVGDVSQGVTGQTDSGDSRPVSREGQV